MEGSRLAGRGEEEAAAEGLSVAVNAARVQLLQGMPIFGALSEGALDCLLHSAASVVRRAGECYFREGDQHAQSIYVVERGAVRVQKHWRGGDWTLKELGVGDCFGEMALLDLEPRSASVCAVTDDTCAIEFGADALHRLFSQDPEQFALLQMNIAREVCRRLRVADEMLLGVRVERAAAMVNPFDERAPRLLFDKGEKELALLELGWAKAALYFRTGWHFGHNRGSMRMRGLVAIHEELDARRARFERGSKAELLHAILICANENLPLPTWLALAFAETFGAFIDVANPTASLDEAFGTQRPGKKGAADKRDWELGSQLYAAAFTTAVEDESIQSLDALLTTVLSKKRWGVAKTKARKLLLQIDETQCELSASDGLSRFLELRRKQVHR